MCNATQDNVFDIKRFSSELDYYEGCDCVVYRYCQSTIITPPPPPSGELPPRCNDTCTDIINIHVLINDQNEKIVQLEDDVDLLISQYQSLAKRVTVLEGKCEGSGQVQQNTQCQQVFQDSINELYDAVNNMTTYCTDATLAEIRDNGIRFGDKWWIGEQGDYLFAIDIEDTSYYRFDPAVNRTLSSYN